MLLGSVEIVHHKGSLSSHRTDINDSIALAIVSPLRCTWVNGPAPQTMYSILKLKKNNCWALSTITNWVAQSSYEKKQNTSVISWLASFVLSYFPSVRVCTPKIVFSLLFCFGNPEIFFFKISCANQRKCYSIRQQTLYPMDGKLSAHYVCVESISKQNEKQNQIHSLTHNAIHSNSNYFTLIHHCISYLILRYLS